MCNSTHQQLQLRSKDDKFVAFYREFECDHESYCLFKLLTCLPTAEEAGLSARKTEEANTAVEEVLASQRLTSAKENKKRKCTIFTPEIRVICLLKTAMEMRAGQCNYLNAITSRFNEMQLIYYAIKTRYTV